MKTSKPNFEPRDFDVALNMDDTIQQRAATAAIVMCEPPSTPRGTFSAIHGFPKTSADGTQGYAAIVVACEPVSASGAKGDGNE